MWHGLSLTRFQWHETVNWKHCHSTTSCIFYLGLHPVIVYSLIRARSFLSYDRAPREVEIKPWYLRPWISNGQGSVHGSTITILTSGRLLIKVGSQNVVAVIFQPNSFSLEITNYWWESVTRHDGLGNKMPPIFVVRFECCEKLIELVTDQRGMRGKLVLR